MSEEQNSLVFFVVVGDSAINMTSDKHGTAELHKKNAGFSAGRLVAGFAYIINMEESTRYSGMLSNGQTKLSYMNHPSAIYL